MKIKKDDIIIWHYFLKSLIRSGESRAVDILSVSLCVGNWNVKQFAAIAFENVLYYNNVECIGLYSVVTVSVCTWCVM